MYENHLLRINSWNN
jgi:hypothetical protein